MAFGSIIIMMLSGPARFLAPGSGIGGIYGASGRLDRLEKSKYTKTENLQEI